MCGSEDEIWVNLHSHPSAAFFLRGAVNQKTAGFQGEEPDWLISNKMKWRALKQIILNY